jgi:4-amino-4-deoxy-L-arabinose transferase-like glycosyltransferase
VTLWKILIPFLLFILALAPRLPGLGRFITTDELTTVFDAGSSVLREFLNGNFRGTYWHFYPGVTMSWLTDLGLTTQYLLEIALGRPAGSLLEYVYGDITSLLVAARLPFAILTALSVPVIYLLARQLLPVPIALLGALFIAFDPFFLAHSRVNHGDAPVAVFMTISLLAFLVFLQRASRTNHRLGTLALVKNPYLLLSAGSGALAALTKGPGQFMAIFVTGISLMYAVRAIWSGREAWQPVISRWVAAIAAWGVASLIVFIVLWPSMWVDPLGTVWQMVSETFGKVEAGHLVYFFGEATLDPGPWFYPVVIAFRLTPVTLIGVLLSLVLLIPGLQRRAGLPEPGGSGLSPLSLLWIYVMLLWWFGNLSPKKQDRYLLPLFPVLGLVAAIGWLGLVKLVFPRFSLRSVFISAILVIFHAIPVISYYPYYLTYFNPLLGGPQQAVKTTLIGWGEGMEQVAAYLNARPNAETLYVAAVPIQTLLPYFRGTGENFYTNDIALRADYVVLYVSQMQRLAPSPEIVRYFEAQTPEKVITISDVPYAKIYPNIPRILNEVPVGAVPMNIGLDGKLRLAGYQLADGLPAVTLYWHALAPLTDNYTVSVRAYAHNGQLLAQQDRWPVDGLLPTSQWRQGDYVADAHTLKLPEAAGWDAVNRLEIVVYDAETGENIGPPIQFDVDNDL